MYLKLRQINIWPSRELVDETQFKIHVIHVMYQQSEKNRAV